LKKAPAGGLFRKTLHTFATLLFGQGASVIAGIATAHAFGPAGKGIISFASILITFAITTADGLRSAVAYQIGSEGQNARSVWHAALRIMAFVAPLSVVIFLVLAHLRASQPAFIYVAVAFPFAMYVQAVGIVYLLRDHVEAINVKNAATIGGGGSLLTLGLILIFHAPVTVVLWAWVATYVAAAVWSTFGVSAMLGVAGAARGAGDLVREQLAFGAKSTLSSNVTFLALRVDVFIVSAMLSPGALGIYTLALATGEVMWGVSRSILWSSSGRVATLPVAESAALTARVVRAVVALQLAAGIVLFVCGPWLITHVYGARFAASGGVLRILLPGMIFYSADGMLSYFISIRAGRPGLLLGLECITLVVCGTVTYATVGRLGIYGAALANTIAYLASYAVKIVFFTRLSGTPPGEVLLPRLDDIPASVRKRFARGAATLPADS
jgi:O-antigen/teichoic acid export membrane protein